MPTYDYVCADCGEFDALRRLSERNEPCACPWCGSASPRVITQAPRLACTTPQQRRAAEVNERSRHAPRSSRDLEGGSYGRLRHPSGCGCCSPRSSAKGTDSGTPALKMQTGRRPWMISH